MFRKKDDLEEYYKERKKEKKYNKYEIELERKVLGKENHQIFQKFLGIIIGVWYEVNIVDTILLIKVDNYEDFLKYSVGDKYPSLFCILSLLYQPSMNSNIASFVSS